MGMSSNSERHPFHRPPVVNSAQQRMNQASQQHVQQAFSREPPMPQPFSGRPQPEFNELYAPSPPPFPINTQRRDIRDVRDVRDYFPAAAATAAANQRVEPYRVSYLPPGGIPLSTSEQSKSFPRSPFSGPSDAGKIERMESQFSLPSSSYSGYEIYGSDPESASPHDAFDYPEEQGRRRDERGRGQPRFHTQRRPSNRDIFDGPHQLLPLPSPGTIKAQERELPHLPTNLDVQEQDRILNQVNEILSKCAFDFVAKYQFPIPIEPDKRQVQVPGDREWTEWVYLLKRLATKRRIPYRVLYNNQIKQLTTVLENSLEMRHAAKHQSRPLKDDRNVLQLISAGIQVAKILKDATAMEYLDRLYGQTEILIQERREQNRRGFAV